MSGVAKGHSLRGEPFTFYGEEQSLKDVITAVATHARLGVRINETIDAKFSGHLKQRNAYDALNYMAASYDLVWYSDGSTLYVDPINALETRLFHLDSLMSHDVKRSMQALSIWDKRFDWRVLSEKAILMVSAPPRYLELLEETIALLKEQSESTAQDSLGVKVFKLIHASAIDRKITSRGQEITVPGIASLLQGLLIAPDSNIAQADTVALSVNGDEDRARIKEQEGGEIKVNKKIEPASTIKKLTTGSFKGAPHPLAAIFADPGGNAVIIQDYKSRLKFYAELIKQLDVRKPQLEISLQIIDLTASSLHDLGVDWTVRPRETGRGLLDLVLPGVSETAIETLVQTNADFLATVSALESQGKAHVTSRPAIVTENGMEALLDNNETFFVRVQGERVATLEEITFGTLLQVVPRIVKSETPTGSMEFINLDVTIEDASRLPDGSVDSLPSIRKTRISTRSSVPNGGSLLIGGYYREATTQNSASVPILGKLPLLGGFFSHKGDSNSQLVRLFMLSPRILSHSIYTAEASYGDELRISHDHQIKQLADLSNFNPKINRLRHKGVCESALSARQRRNRQYKENIVTRIMPCNDEGSAEMYRVVSFK